MPGATGGAGFPGNGDQLFAGLHRFGKTGEARMQPLLHDRPDALRDNILGRAAVDDDTALRLQFGERPVDPTIDPKPAVKKKPKAAKAAPKKEAAA